MPTPTHKALSSGFFRSQGVAVICRGRYGGRGGRWERKWGFREIRSGSVPSAAIPSWRRGQSVNNKYIKRAALAFLPAVGAKLAVLVLLEKNTVVRFTEEKADVTKKQ